MGIEFCKTTLYALCFNNFISTLCDMKPETPRRLQPRSSGTTTGACSERLVYSQPTDPNPLNHRDDFSRPALRHGSLNSHFPGSLLSTFLAPSLHSTRVRVYGSGCHFERRVHVEPLIICQLGSMKFTAQQILD